MPFLVGHTPWNKKNCYIKCRTCGMQRSVKPSYAKKMKYCSFKCYWESKKGKDNGNLSNVDTSGANNANWKGGIYRPEFRLGREARVRFYLETKEIVLERDNYECQLCGSKENLQVDHIQSWSEYIELRFSIDNCRTLCMKCHYKVTFGRPMPKKTKVWGQNYKHIMKGGY
jgi:5-methylcytosine-specific restriction endonuclease McrA